MLMKTLHYAESIAVVTYKIVAGRATMASHRDTLQTERFRDQLRLFPLVDRERADGRAGARVPPRIYNFAAEKRPQTGLDETPGAHVLRFFLAPDEFGALRERLEHLPQFMLGQRIELLDADDRGVGDLFRLPVIQEIVINLAGAKDDALHLFRGPHFRRAQNFRESAGSEIFGARCRLLRAQQTFRRHD